MTGPRTLNFTLQVHGPKTRNSDKGLIIWLAKMSGFIFTEKFSGFFSSILTHQKLIFAWKIVHEILKVSSKLSLAYYLMSEIFSGFLIDFIIFIICRLYSVPLYVHCTEVIFVTD